MTQRNGYIALTEAAKELGVNRSTMYYYKKNMGIEHKKFNLDKRKYISIADFERLKEARQLASWEPPSAGVPKKEVL